jgi:internalin A
MKMKYKHMNCLTVLLAVTALVLGSPFITRAQDVDPENTHKVFLQRRSEAKQVLDAAGVRYKSFFVQQDDSYALTLSSSVTNLNALAGLPVSSLKLFMCTNVVDLSGVTNIPSLKSLHLEGLKGTDLAPLAHTRLEKLFLRGTHITDFTPLKGLPLKELTSNGAWFKDVSCLRGMPLTDLNIEYTGVTDLTPLKGMQIKQLGIIGSDVTDLSPLEGMPLRGISLTPATVKKGYDALRRMKTLEGVYVPYESLTMPEFWQRLNGEKKDKTEPEN